MKLNQLNTGIVGCLLTVALSGCNQSSSSTTPEAAPKVATSAPAAAQSTTEKVVAEVKPVVEKVVAEVKPAVEKAVDKAVQAVAEPIKSSSSEVAGIIAKSQSLVGEKKYKEALTELASLKDAKLTEGQQKIVDELKAQIPKLMSGDVGKTINNLLGK